MWKKRLFDEISSDFNIDEQKGNNKRTILSPDYFPCPQCAHCLTTTTTGLHCTNCELIIPLAYQKDLSPQGIKTMINLAKQQHGLCPGGDSKVTSSTLGLPDGNDLFLVWTCGGCGELEILL